MLPSLPVQTAILGVSLVNAAGIPGPPPSTPTGSLTTIPHEQTSRFLSNNTARFAVDGSALPDINFDIGESYAGNLPNGPNSTLWFWFVPSTNPAASNEILLWLNGGPGCSSLEGFFHENGPVTWKPGTYRPVKNPYAWTNLTNVLWVDQPVGTGFSTGKVTALDEEDVVSQFMPFWRTFIDTFGLQGSDVYTSGESYAGTYIPYITSAMLDDGYCVKGTMLYDPVIKNPYLSALPPLLPFLDFQRNVLPLNNSFSEHIHAASAQCGWDAFLERALIFPPPGPLPAQVPGVAASGELTDACNFIDDLLDAIKAVNPCFNIYNVAQQCPLPWDVIGQPNGAGWFAPGYTDPYFNHTAVKKALHAPVDMNWIACPPTPNHHPVFLGPDGDTSLPPGVDGGPLIAVIEQTNNVIISHGVLDMVLIMNGSLANLNNMTWNGAQGFSSPPHAPLFVPYHDVSDLASAAGAGVLGSCTSERGLTFCAIDASGHQVPQFQPSVAYRQLELLLGRISSLSEVSTFTTQPGIAQPDVAPVSGNAPVLRRASVNMQIEEKV